MSILLAAIAKDESPYLAEWVYYHLKLGFNAIKIYINNTTDSSVSILANINKKYPNVTYEVVDFILEENYKINENLVTKKFHSTNRIQSRSYADILEKNKNFDNIMFLDIDEYLFLKDKYSLRKLCDKHSNFAVKWFNETGDALSFAPALKRKIKGTKARNFKSCISTRSKNIRIINSHAINIQDKRAYLLGYGQMQTGFDKHQDTSWDDNAFIIHRHLRSQKEYLALLLRGDTIKNSSDGYKSNRRGWYNKYSHEIEIEFDKVYQHVKGLNKFIFECEIQSIILESRQMLLDKAESVIKREEKRSKEMKILKRIFNGTEISDFY
ncbi:glycosyltransferase family 2 protein [Vibrio breoganii]